MKNYVQDTFSTAAGVVNLPLGSNKLNLSAFYEKTVESSTNTRNGHRVCSGSMTSTCKQDMRVLADIQENSFESLMSNTIAVLFIKHQSLYRSLKK